MRDNRIFQNTHGAGYAMILNRKDRDIGLTAFALTLTLSCLSGPALAQESVHFVLAQPAGGAVDLVSRTIDDTYAAATTDKNAIAIRKSVINP